MMRNVEFCSDEIKWVQVIEADTGCSKTILPDNLIPKSIQRNPSKIKYVTGVSGFRLKVTETTTLNLTILGKNDKKIHSVSEILLIKRLKYGLHGRNDLINMGLVSDLKDLCVNNT
uniref:RVP domain-containing protein n=1 Tax=Strongyloides venezuelensis TaxID=75913 RepID=A0A0K0FCA0_STRVS